MSYKWCAVPACTNTAIKTPEKLFITVPRDVKIGKKLLQLARGDPKEIKDSSVIFFYEGHFDGVGSWLMVSGVELSGDSDYVNLGYLLPRVLPFPLPYCVALGACLLGLIIAFISCIGAAATYTLNKILFALYFFGLVVLLTGESAGMIVVGTNPSSIGISVDPAQLADSWQRHYTVPGSDRHTAAIDYIQVKYECCGSKEGKEWMESWWKIREYGPKGYVVPLSCCIQEGNNHLDMTPSNITACQSQDAEVHEFARHTQGCAVILDAWSHDCMKKWFYASLVIMLYQLCLLLATICGTVHLLTNKHTSKNSAMT